jgi:sugar lactone lactonase YvrE
MCVVGGFLASCSDSDDSPLEATSPKLISIIPKAGSVGGTAIVSGVNFSTSLADNEVYIGESRAEITSASSNRLVITLPSNENGEYGVRVKVKGNTVEGLKFRYAQAQQLSLAVLQVMPSSAYIGDEVVLIGQCFGTDASVIKVSINGIDAEVKSVSDTQIKIIVPDTETEGTYAIRVTKADKTADSPMFTYLHTVRLNALSLSPVKGKAGMEVTVEGEDFGKTPADNQISINGQKAEVTRVTSSQLVFVAPENPAGEYHVVITVGNRTVSNLTFTYVAEVYMVATAAGSGTGALTDGAGTAASFKAPDGIACALDGSFWIADRGNNAIRRMDAQQNVTTVAKTGTVTFNAPWQGAFDSKGNYYVANKALNNIIKITPSGECAVFETTTTFKSPMSVTFDASDNMYVSDRDNKAVKKITPSGEVTVYDMSSCASGPNCCVVDKRGRILVGTGGTYRIHMFDTDGTMTTVMGTGVKPTAATYSDASGDLTTVPMGATFGIALDASGNLLITDYTMHTVRLLTPDADDDYAKGTLKTIAGVAGTKGKLDGAGGGAAFNCPSSVCVADGIIYVTDEQNHLIRTITLSNE